MVRHGSLGDYETSDTYNPIVFILSLSVSSSPLFLNVLSQYTIPIVLFILQYVSPIIINELLLSNDNHGHINHVIIIITIITDLRHQQLFLFSIFDTIVVSFKQQ